MTDKIHRYLSAADLQIRVGGKHSSQNVFLSCLYRVKTLADLRRLCDLGNKTKMTMCVSLAFYRIEMHIGISNGFSPMQNSMRQRAFPWCMPQWMITWAIGLGIALKSCLPQPLRVLDDSSSVLLILQFQGLWYPFVWY